MAVKNYKEHYLKEISIAVYQSKPLSEEQQMGATETLAEFIAGLKYDELPSEVVEAAKVGIIDGVGNMLAGSTQPLAGTIGEYHT